MQDLVDESLRLWRAERVILPEQGLNLLLRLVGVSHVLVWPPGPRSNAFDIPRVIVLPKGVMRAGFRDFSLDLSSFRLQPVSQEILVRHLESGAEHVIGALTGGTEEERIEDYVVRGLIDFDDVSYDEQADLLYKLAGEVVAHLRGYLKGVFQIRYSADANYEPDFVVETETEKLICEPKGADRMQDPVVLAKARAAATWCKHAAAHEMANKGKPWRYLLIPHDAIADNMTLAGLTKSYTFAAPDEGK